MQNILVERLDYLPLVLRVSLNIAMPAFTQPFQLNAMPSTNFQITAGDESLDVQPIANGATPTKSSFSINANTGSMFEREFMANFGLNSSTQGGDKVSLFTGLEALPGTSDVWTLYSTMGLNANSGVYNSICYEMDLDNNNAHRGNNGNLNTDFTQVNAVGLSVTGNSLFSSTSAVLISSQNQTGSGAPQWNRGITSVGTFGLTAYQDWTTAPVGMQFDGTYQIAAINMASVYNNPGANCPTAMLMKNNQALAWQTANTTSVVSLKVDPSNNVILGNGAGAIVAGAPVAPLAPGTSLGTSGNFWGPVFSNFGIAAPSDLELKINVSALNAMSGLLPVIAPIRFQYGANPGAWHYGFAADDIRRWFEPEFAGYLEADGQGHVIKDELIAVLWQTCRELLDRVSALEARALPSAP